jgi:hypothetical protein
MPTSAEIKKAIVAAGLEVYRTRGHVVQLADRVRENLLMDSGVSIHGRHASHASAPKVVFIVRAQRTDFPSDGEERLFDRARGLAAAAVARGFREADTHVREVCDPGDAARRLDTWYEVQFEKAVADVQTAIDEARFVIGLEKSAAPQ